MPVTSWQFWIVTLISAAGILLLIRPFIGNDKNRNKGCCGKQKKKKTKLTIRGK